MRVQRTFKRAEPSVVARPRRPKANASGSTSYVVDNNGLTESALHAAHGTAARVDQTSIAGIAVAAPSRCNAHRSTLCQ